ncbi:MAG: DEAD/DEAH box helicase, partial [Planctomycetaceae bacterium]|nr:DEAD/DEAH box helicase [Planctomycetaceae bacterium]
MLVNDQRERQPFSDRKLERRWALPTLRRSVVTDSADPGNLLPARSTASAGDISSEEVALRYLDQLPWTPYPFQEQAILTWFDCEDGLLVCAPTGTGKTVIAETALFEALLTGRRAYYTTPLIALTEQKFRELQDSAER